jgi:hypothetical protein
MHREERCIASGTRERICMAGRKTHECKRSLSSDSIVKQPLSSNIVIASASEAIHRAAKQKAGSLRRKRSLAQTLRVCRRQ